MNRHVGELPWGASFGFGNDVEVPLPYDSRTNDFNIGAQWNNTRNMLSVAYTGSWFDNLDTPLIWDSPLRLDDSTSAPGRGRTSLWPSNTAQTVSIGGFTKFAHRTQLTGFLSFGSWKNNETLQPFTINSALPQLALPRPTTEGEAGIVSTNLNLVSRPSMDWRFSARFRSYDYSNQAPRFAIAQYVSYDTSVNEANTGGPQLYAHSRTNFDTDATWTKLQPVALTVGYSAQQHEPRLSHLREHRRRRVPSDRGCGGLTIRVVPRPIRVRIAHRFRSGRERADRDWRTAGDAPLRRRQPESDQIHRPGRLLAQRPVDAERVGRRRQGRFPGQLLRRGANVISDGLIRS